MKSGTSFNATILSSSKSSSCFNLTGTFTADTGHFQVNYVSNMQPNSLFIPVVITSALTDSGKNATCNEAEGSPNTVHIQMTSDEAKQVVTASVNGKNVGFVLDDTGIKLSSADKNPTVTLKGVLDGSITVTASGCQG